MTGRAIPAKKLGRRYVIAAKALWGAALFLLSAGPAVAVVQPTPTPVRPPRMETDPQTTDPRWAPARAALMEESVALALCAADMQRNGRDDGASRR